MKKLRWLLLSLLWVFFACENTTYSVSAKAGSQEWVSNAFTVAAQGQNGILINANNENLPPFALLIGDFANAGTFALDSLSNTLQYGDGQSGLIYKNRPSRPGVLVITAVEPNNKRIAGTFSATLFTATNDSIKITDGKFDVNYL